MAAKFTARDVRELMDDLPKVRNLGVIGAMAAGKTCALDCLGVTAGLVAEDKIGETRFTLVRPDEREKGSTLKSNITSMVINGNLLSVVDTPGHPDFSAELSAAMPLIDGALFVIDGSGGGMAAQTGRQVREAVSWAVEPVLFCNRLDVSLLVTQKSAGEIADDLFQAVEEFNTALGASHSTIDFKPTVNAEKGTILFGSLAQGWAFSLPQLAQTYASKFGIEEQKMASKLWGDTYFNVKSKKWSSASGEGAVRTFEHFVLAPIMQVLSACEAGNLEKLQKMSSSLGFTMGAADKKLEGKALFRRVMQLWMPAGVAIASACQQFMPDPAAAQQLRFPLLSTAPTTDPTAEAVKSCSKDGPALFLGSKMAPQPGAQGRFYMLGRVFSGTLGADKVQLLDADHKPPRADEEEAAEAEEDAFCLGEAAMDGEAGEDGAAAEDGEKSPKAGSSPANSAPGTPKSGPATPTSAQSGSGTPNSRRSSGAKVIAQPERRVQSMMVCQAKTFTATQNVPAGNLCAVAGVDQFVSKTTTLCVNRDHYPLMPPKLLVSCVVRMSVHPKEAKDLPKLVEALKRLSKSCLLVDVKLEDSGTHVVAGCGSEHMRVLCKDLQVDYLGEGIPVTWGVPSVAYREVVTAESSMLCLSKSPNKHNRLYMKAEPLSEEFCMAVEAQKIFQTQDVKKRAKLLDKEFSWDKNDALKLWGFGPGAESLGEAHGTNCIVDQTKGIQYLNEIRESVNSGLLWASKQGPICEENMRGIRFNLLDVKMHADSIHRGMGQIQPTARRVLFACTMTASCRLSEPVFVANIEAPVETSTGIMQALGACRGELVLSEEQGTRLAVQAYVPIVETIGQTPFATVLSQKTNGKAFVSYEFDHWQVLPSDPLQVDKNNKPMSKAAEVMLSIRERKGLKIEAPKFADYYDKL